MDNRTIEELSTTIKHIISITFNKKPKDNTYNDIILSKIITNKDSIICHKIKTYQMKIGDMWQNIIGTIENITNLKRGHTSGLDLLSTKHKFIMELKNAYNTCNSSSRTNIYDKMIEFKRKNPNYELIFAYINCNTKNNNGKDEIIIYKSEKIRILSGNKLLSYLFGDKYVVIISIITTYLQDFL